MTDAERQQRRRDRRKAGLVRVDVWVPKPAEDAVRAAIDRAVAEAAAGRVAYRATKGKTADAYEPRTPTRADAGAGAV